MQKSGGRPKNAKIDGRIKNADQRKACGLERDGALVPGRCETVEDTLEGRRDHRPLSISTANQASVGRGATARPRCGIDRRQNGSDRLTKDGGETEQSRDPRAANVVRADNDDCRAAVQ